MMSAILNPKTIKWRYGSYIIYGYDWIQRRFTARTYTPSTGWDCLIVMFPKVKKGQSIRMAVINCMEREWQRWMSIHAPTVGYYQQTFKNSLSGRHDPYAKN